MPQYITGQILESMQGASGSNAGLGGTGACYVKVGAARIK